MFIFNYLLDVGKGVKLLSPLKMVFKIVMLNIRSLFPSINLIDHYFKDFDIICLCETWLTQGHTDAMIKITGYGHARLDRSAGNILNSNNHPKRGGGLIIYYKESLTPYVNILSNCSKITPHLEQLWIQIKQPNHRKQIISLLYRPPSGMSSRFFEELNQSMENSQEYINAETTILGDINIDYKLRHTTDFDKIKEFERDFQLKQFINSPTRITRRNSSILDLIFSNMEHIESTGVLDYQVSDHAPVFITKKKQKTKKSSYMTKGRTYKNYNCHAFQQLILEDPRWVDYWDPKNDVDLMWQIMYGIIIDAADIICPSVNMKILDGNPNWFSQEILEEIHLKDELFREYKDTKSDVTWERYVLQRNRVKLLIKTGKEEFVKDQIELNSSNPKKFWRKINTFTGLGKERSSSTLTNLVNNHGETVSGKDAIEYMNEYYASAGYDLKFDIPWHPNLAIFNNYDGLSFQNVTQYEVCKLIKDINISKSSAYTDISSRLLKDAFIVLTRELTHRYNTSIDCGIFPKDWGLAEVTPIPKTGDLSNAKNWRPISQIKLPGKLLERLIHTQLSIYFESILDKNQHGFRQCKSTGTAVFDVLRDLFQIWNGKEYSSCIFIEHSIL